MRIYLWTALFTSAVLFCFVSLAKGEDTFVAEKFARKTIYHSPETPGYTCWVGAWLMPDQSMMVTFDQATGPLTGRSRAPDQIQNINQWLKENPKRDFTGLKLANIYLRSSDRGASWEKVAEAEFSGPFDRPVYSQSHIGLSDGTLLRAIDGSQLPTTPDLPRRVYFQRSADLGKSWRGPLVPPEPTRPVEFLGDYGDGFTRIRKLRDGRLIALGTAIRDVIRYRGPGVPPATNLPLILVSEDNSQTWTPVFFLPTEHHKPGAWNEWDAAELSNGDLLCVVRRTDPTNPKKQVRWQGLLEKQGKSWRLKEFHLSTLEHSGHPELLVTQEGVILHIATEGIHWTADAGKTWTPVVFPGLSKSFRPRSAPDSLKTRYYPKALQIEDGTIFVFAHNGWDNAYGDFDQSIVMDTFRLTK